VHSYASDRVTGVDIEQVVSAVKSCWTSAAATPDRELVRSTR
jgi:hypothetical protein